MSSKVNWLRLFREFNVEYIDHGHNVKKGNVNICCPFCVNDQKFFMGVDPSSGAWGCWWSKEHRGMSPIRLIMRLLRVSYERAREIAGLGESYIDPEGFAAMADRLMGRSLPEQESEGNKSLSFLREFREISPTGAARRFWNYLEGRGFDDVSDLCDRYQLRCAISGDFQDRVIIPFIVNGEIVAWTGRAIGSTTLRYRDSPKEINVINPKETLFNIDAAKVGGKALVVVEGQFDVLKSDYYGSDFGVRSVGISTRMLTDDQVYVLNDIAGRFDRVVLMLDTAKKTDVVGSMDLMGQLSDIRNLEYASVPYGYKDCGAMPPGRIAAFCKSLQK